MQHPEHGKLQSRELVQGVRREETRRAAGLTMTAHGILGAAAAFAILVLVCLVVEVLALAITSF
jgi:hypothetical protein